MNRQQPAADDISAAVAPVLAGAQAGEQASARQRRRLINDRTAPWLAWTLWALSVVLSVLALLLYSVNSPADLVSQLLITPAFLSFPTVGALIVSNRPDHPIGWIFLAVGLICVGIFGEQYAVYSMMTYPGSLPGGLLVGAIGAVASGVGFYLPFTFLLLLFPDGHLPSPRWRPIAWFAAGFLVVYSIAPVLTPGPIEIMPSVQNPMGVEGLAGTLQVLQVLETPALLFILIAGVVSVGLRYRRGDRDEREQLKWVFFAASMLPLVFLTTTVAQELWGALDNPEINAFPIALVALSIAAVPVSVGIAILRYRLYDIDLIINRTLVYVPLTGILAGLYSGTVALFQKLFTGITGEKSDAAIVLTTLVLAAAFTPIKNTLQSLVDRRFKEAPDRTKRLKELSKQVQSVIDVIDAGQVSRRL
ncbi:MAG TPA: hypothetical protein VFR15_14810, partial [Chloroflexia bacterium]|nr:hypothetical protein [Chloroflexia bacterium]